jgi:hypothetical protein
LFQTEEPTPSGRSSVRPWRLSLLILLIVAAVDVLTGRHLILIGLLIAVPLCAMFTAQWVSTARAGILAVALAVVLAIPDGIWATPAQVTLACAVLMVGLACTWGASVLQTATKTKGGRD